MNILKTILLCSTFTIFPSGKAFSLDAYSPAQDAQMPLIRMSIEASNALLKEKDYEKARRLATELANHPRGYHGIRKAGIEILSYLAIEAKDVPSTAKLRMSSAALVLERRENNQRLRTAVNLADLYASTGNMVAAIEYAEYAKKGFLKTRLQNKFSLLVDYKLAHYYFLNEQYLDAMNLSEKNLVDLNGENRLGLTGEALAERIHHNQIISLGSSWVTGNLGEAVRKALRFADGDNDNFDCSFNAAVNNKEVVLSPTNNCSVEFVETIFSIQKVRDNLAELSGVKPYTGSAPMPDVVIPSNYISGSISNPEIYKYQQNALHFLYNNKIEKAEKELKKGTKFSLGTPLERLTYHLLSGAISEAKGNESSVATNIIEYLNNVENIHPAARHFLLERIVYELVRENRANDAAPFVTQLLNERSSPFDCAAAAKINSTSNGIVSEDPLCNFYQGVTFNERPLDMLLWFIELGEYRDFAPKTRLDIPHPNTPETKNINGYVILEVESGSKGKVHSVQVFESHPAGLFDEYVLNTVRASARGLRYPKFKTRSSGGGVFRLRHRIELPAN